MEGNESVDKFNTSTWIPWLGATVMAALTLCAFLFTQFETKADSLDKRNSLEKRLDRIENKIDFLKDNLIHK